MSLEELRMEVSKLKRWRRRSRTLSILKYAFYVFIILVAIGSLYRAYEDAHMISISLDRSPAIERVGFLAYRVTVYPNIHNPTSSTYMLKNLYAKVYVNDHFIMETFKPYLTIERGDNYEVFQFELNLRDLPQSVMEAISNDGVMKIKISGFVTVPLNVFGIPWRDVTIPLDLLPEYTYHFPDDDRERLIKVLYMRSGEGLSELTTRMSEMDGKISMLFEQIKNLEGRIDDTRIDMLSRIEDVRSELLSSIPEIYLVRIVRVEAPVLASEGETIEVTVLLDHVLTRMTTVFVGIYYAGDLLESKQVTLQGSSVTPITLNVKLPTLGSREFRWELSIYISYYRDGALYEADNRKWTIFSR